MDLEVIKLENGQEYAVIKEIEDYVYLVNTNDENDLCIRKNINNTGIDTLITLNDENEFNKALELFKNEMNKDSN